MQACTLCPRQCGANRSTGTGLCGAGGAMLVSRAAPHMWEEPCISGTSGSGTVFFAGCPLGCVFCQNHTISHTAHGKAVSAKGLADIFLTLQGQGVHNINLVTAGHFWPGVVQAVRMAKQSGLQLPVVWNTSSYETSDAIAALTQVVDVWLADLKFHSPSLAGVYCKAPDYFAYASRAILQMAQSTGPPQMDKDGLLQKGLVVRLPVLPGAREDAKQLLHWMAKELPENGFLLSLMRQYTPPPGLALPRPLHRRLSSFEYNDVVDTAIRLGVTNGFIQEPQSADSSYTPAFDLTGL